MTSLGLVKYYLVYKPYIMFIIKQVTTKTHPTPAFFSQHFQNYRYRRPIAGLLETAGIG